MRKPMVTRSFETMKIDVLVYDTSIKQVVSSTCTLSRVIDDTDKLEKAIKNYYKDSTLKFVDVVNVEKVTKLYGMLESDFLKNSVELDPETRKAIEEE